MRPINPKLSKQHFSTKIFKSYISYLEKHFPDLEPSQICEEAGLPFNYILNEDNWVSITYERRFYNLCVRATGDKRLAEKVGLFSLSRSIVGAPLYFLIRNTLSLSEIYKNIPKLSPMFNKVMSVKLEAAEARKLTFAYRFILDGLTDHEATQLKEAEDDIIANTSGYFAGIPTVKDLPRAHTEITREPNGFRIAVELPTELGVLGWKFSIKTAIALAFSYFLSLMLANNVNAILISLQVAAILIFWKKYGLVKEAARETQTALQRADLSYQEIQVIKSDLQRKLNETTVINKISDSIFLELGPQNILDGVCQSLVGDLGYDRVVILLDDGEGAITYAASAGLSNELAILFKNFSIPTRIDSNDPRKLTNVYRFGAPILISDVKQHLDSLLPESRTLLTVSNSTSFLCSGIASEGSKFGVIIADCYHKEKVFGQDDLKVLKVVGQQIAQALERNRSKAREIESFERINSYGKNVLALTAQLMQEPLQTLGDLIRSSSDPSLSSKAVAPLATLTKAVSEIQENRASLRKYDPPSGPAAKDKTRSKQRTGLPISTRKAGRILIVEDHLEHQEALAKTLQIAGYQIEVANNGREAIDLVTSGYRPDLILMDVMMPVMAGYEATDLIRKLFSRAEVPILFLINKSQDPDYEVGYKIGGNDFIDKSIASHELVAKIQTHLATAEIAKAYSRFVPWKMFELLNYKSVLDVKIGDGIECEMTVMFCDIRNFTTLCEQLSPSDILRFLNSYLEMLSPAISQMNGFIDSFIGDCIMAIFPTANDALSASKKLLLAVNEMNSRSDFERFGRIAIGIGINTGPMILGPIGYEGRLQITSMSDAVNTASRVEALCKDFGSNIVLTETTLGRLSPHLRANLRLLGEVSVKGKKIPVRIFEDYSNQPLDVRYTTEKALPKFEQAVNLFLKGSIEEAGAIFSSLQQNSMDKAVSYYLEKISKTISERKAA
jgi:class 3 adenylate cyclase/CheY-like chemotaxis protein